MESGPQKKSYYVPIRPNRVPLTEKFMGIFYDEDKQPKKVEESVKGGDISGINDEYRRREEIMTGGSKVRNVEPVSVLDELNYDNVELPPSKPKVVQEQFPITKRRKYTAIRGNRAPGVGAKYGSLLRMEDPDLESVTVYTYHDEKRPEVTQPPKSQLPQDVVETEHKMETEEKLEPIVEVQDDRERDSKGIPKPIFGAGPDPNYPVPKYQKAPTQIQASGSLSRRKSSPTQLNIQINGEPAVTPSEPHTPGVNQDSISPTVPTSTDKTPVPGRKSFQVRTLKPTQTDKAAGHSNQSKESKGQQFIKNGRKDPARGKSSANADHLDAEPTPYQSNFDYGKLYRKYNMIYTQIEIEEMNRLGYLQELPPQYTVPVMSSQQEESQDLIESLYVDKVYGTDDPSMKTTPNKKNLNIKSRPGKLILTQMPR